MECKQCKQRMMQTMQTACVDRRYCKSCLGLMERNSSAEWIQKQTWHECATSSRKARHSCIYLFLSCRRFVFWC